MAHAARHKVLGSLVLPFTLQDIVHCLRLTKALAAETGAGEEFLESAASSAGTSAGKKGSAGRSAGSSAALLCNTVNGTASSTPPGTHLSPGTGPSIARSTFQEFLSSTRLCGQQQRFRNLRRQRTLEADYLLRERTAWLLKVRGSGVRDGYLADPLSTTLKVPLRAPLRCPLRCPF